MPPVLRGIDRAQVITPQELATAQDALGVTLDFCLVYVGGPRNGGQRWTREAVDALAERFPALRFLPVYVGRNAPWDGAEAFTLAQGVADGNEAVAILQQMGLAAEGASLCLDLEMNTWQERATALDYIDGWRGAVQAASIIPILYSGIAACAEIQRRGWEMLTYPAYWPWSGTNWLRLQSADWPLLNLTLGGLSHTPEAWQFVGDVPVIGSVDLSIARDDFPMVRPVDVPSPTTTTETEPPVSDETLPQDTPQDQPQDTPSEAPQEAPQRDFGAELDSLSGSVSELYARVGALEARQGEVRDAAPAPEPEPTPPPELDANQIATSAGDTLPKIANAQGHPGESGALQEANPDLHGSDPIPPGTVVTLPDAWLAQARKDTDEVSTAAESLRALFDQLARDPEAVTRLMKAAGQD